MNDKLTKIRNEDIGWAEAEYARCGVWPNRRYRVVYGDQVSLLMTQGEARETAKRSSGYCYEMIPTLAQHMRTKTLKKGNQAQITINFQS